MKPQDIIKAIAELDGWTNICNFKNGWLEKGTGFDKFGRKGMWGQNENGLSKPCKDYLNSRDAIVPVIEKQDEVTRRCCARFVYVLRSLDLLRPEPSDDYVWQSLLLATPSQLSEALLRATGKWKEE